MQTKQTRRFDNREEAGAELAKRLAKFAGSPNLIVLAMPNGGVPVGARIASLLNKPFDVLLMEKITAPGSDGKSLGAVTAGGVRVLNGAMIDRLHLSQSEVNTAILHGCQKLARREKNCRGQSIPLDIADSSVILVDDGTTPCSALRDAIRLLRRQHAEQVIVALPIACRHTACDLRFEANEVVTLTEAETPRSVEKWIEQGRRTTDEEVCRLLAETHSTAISDN